MQLRTSLRPAFEALELRRMLAMSDISITEIMYHPFVGDMERVEGMKDRDFEFVEIVNSGNLPARLSGATLSDAVDVVFGDVTLEPGRRGIVVHNRLAFESRYGDQLVIAGEYQGTLGNGGDRLVLQDSAGRVIQEFTYDDAWYSITDGGGYSLTAVDPSSDQLDRNLASSWQVSSRMNGSPAFADGIHDPRPMNLVFSTLSSRDLRLSWDPPQKAGSAVRTYYLYRDNELIGSTQASTFLDSTAAPDRRYVYHVAVVHQDGREVPSVPLVVQTEVLGGDLKYSSGISRGTVDVPGLNELSGMTASRRIPNVFWTHNDGPQSVIYGVNTQGDHIATVRLGNTISSLDWEDITIGNGPIPSVDYIYVGDIGGKTPKRNVVRVYRLPEPVVSEDDRARTLDADSVETIVLQYPDDDEFNSETLLLDPRTGDLYILPKQGSDTPVFRAAADRLDDGTTLLLERVGTIGFPNVSGGDISPSGGEIILRNEDLAQRYVRSDGESLAAAFATGRRSLIPVVGRPIEPNGEAITFDNHGNDYFTISEGDSPTIYEFERIPTPRPGDANRDQFFDSSDLVQVLQAGKYETGLPALFSEGDWNGDGRFDSSDLVAALQMGHYEQPVESVARDVAGQNLDDWTDTSNHRHEGS